MNGHDELFAHTESVLSRLGDVDPDLIDPHIRLREAIETYRSAPRKSSRQQELLEALLEALEDDDELRGALLESVPSTNTVSLKTRVRN